MSGLFLVEGWHLKQVDDVERALRAQAADLQSASVPLETLDHAIENLQGWRKTLDDAEPLAAINGGTMHPLLRQRLTAVRGELDQAAQVCAERHARAKQNDETLARMRRSLHEGLAETLRQQNAARAAAPAADDLPIG